MEKEVNRKYSDFTDFDTYRKSTTDGATTSTHDDDDYEGTWDDNMAGLKGNYSKKDARKILMYANEDDMDEVIDDEDWNTTMESLKSKIWEDESDFRDVERNMLNELDADMDNLMAVMDTSYANDLVATDIDENTVADIAKQREPSPQKKAPPPPARQVNTVIRDVPEREEDRVPPAPSNRRFGPFQKCIDYLFKSCKCS